MQTAANDVGGGYHACAESTYGSWVSPYMDNTAVLKSSVFSASADQWVESTLYIASGYSPSGGNFNHECQHRLRHSVSTGSITGYEFLYNTKDGMGVFVKWEGPEGSFTSNTNSSGTFIGTPADGAVLRTEIQGTTARAYFNGVLKLTADLTKDQGGTTIATWNSGQPGMGFWCDNAGTPANAGWKAWACGNL